MEAASRIEAWRDLFGRAICQAGIEPLKDVEFRSDVLLRALPGLGLASGVCSGALYHRSNSLVVNDDLIFVVNHAGIDHAQMFGRDTVVRSGEAVLLTTGAPGAIVNRSRTRFTTLRIPRAALARFVSDIETSMVRSIEASNDALQLLLNYISVLEDRDALSTPEQCSGIVSNVHDLIALSVGANKDGIAHARKGGVAAARLWAVKCDIRDHVGSRDLSPQAIAARHGMTKRYLHMLFEREGLSLSEFVALQKLAAAHKQLSDPSLLQRKIADIALASGFDDISYFNRRFRRAFGRTPSDLRNDAFSTAERIRLLTLAP